jgi:hypothetical protein
VSRAYHARLLCVCIPFTARVWHIASPYWRGCGLGTAQASSVNFWVLQEQRKRNHGWECGTEGKNDRQRPREQHTWYDFSCYLLDFTEGADVVGVANAPRRNTTSNFGPPPLERSSLTADLGRPCSFLFTYSNSVLPSNGCGFLFVIHRMTSPSLICSLTWAGPPGAKPAT